MNNKIIVLCGKSGTGKDSLAKLVKERLNLNFVVSHTTRPMREGESNKNPYYFIDCSRVPDELTKSYRSLQITGTNVTNTPTELVVFAFYERSFKLNTINGQIDSV